MRITEGRHEGKLATVSEVVAFGGPSWRLRLDCFDFDIPGWGPSMFEALPAVAVMSAPMDPERLRVARVALTTGDDKLAQPYASMLLAAHDHWLTEAKRYRDRCPVTAEDVEAAGVTRARAEMWLRLAGHEPYDLLGHSTLWRDPETTHHACTTSGSTGDLAAAITRIADEDAELCAVDILDEMAAQSLGADHG